MIDHLIKLACYRLNSVKLRIGYSSVHIAMQELLVRENIIVKHFLNTLDRILFHIALLPCDVEVCRMLVAEEHLAARFFNLVKLILRVCLIAVIGLCLLTFLSKALLSNMLH